jgi:hypothetical protein
LISINDSATWYDADSELADLADYCNSLGIAVNGQITCNGEDADDYSTVVRESPEDLASGLRARPKVV